MFKGRLPGKCEDFSNWNQAVPRHLAKHADWTHNVFCFTQGDYCLWSVFPFYLLQTKARREKERERKRKGKEEEVMHNGDRDGSPERSGLVSCGHWMMPMLWSGGKADKISNKLAGDIACLGGSMAEHQPRLLGSRVRFPAGVFAIFPFLPKLHFQFPFPFLLPSSSFPFLILSLPLPFPFLLPSTFRVR